jgi:hypothetical protein
MIPRKGVMIFKSDEGRYLVLWQKQYKDNSIPHYPFLSSNENEPINFYTINGFPIRYYTIGIPEPGFELKTSVFLTLEKTLEYISTIEVLQ